MKRVLRDVVAGAVGCVVTVGAGAGVLVATAGDAFAQQSAPEARQAQQQGVAIRRILVEGNQRIEAPTITSYLLVRPGDTFDAERIDMSLKTLFATGLFADVQIEQRGGDLVVAVIENPIINRVIFEGLRTLDEDDLEKEVQARPRSVFTPARAQGDVQRIIEVYRRAGRFAAQVTPQVRELDQNRVDLIFEVDEGPVTGVRDINFIGNDVYSDRTLRGAIVTTVRLVEFSRATTITIPIASNTTANSCANITTTAATRISASSRPSPSSRPISAISSSPSRSMRACAMSWRGERRCAA